MKDHGVKMESMYPTMQQEQPTIYPSISLPAEVFDEEYQPGDECCVYIKVKIRMMSENHYECDLLGSEECDEDEAEE